MVLLPLDKNGERKQTTMSDHVHTLDQTQASEEDQLRLKLKVDGEQLDDLISYNQLIEYSEDTQDTRQTEDGLYKFKSIQDHRCSYSSFYPEYLGSSYNLLVEWENGEMTWEHQSNIIIDDTYSCAVNYHLQRSELIQGVLSP